MALNEARRGLGVGTGPCLLAFLEHVIGKLAIDPFPK